MTPIEERRRDKLLLSATTLPLTQVEITELGHLERRHHAFGLMCTRTAPINPLALGYFWDEPLRHPAAPDKVARVRARGMVEIDGEAITLMEATRRIAAYVKRGLALADWSGTAGRLGDVAGLEHPPRRAPAGGSVTTTERSTPSRPKAAIGDLFD